MTIDKIRRGLDRKDFSVVELIKSYISRAKKLNPKLNVFITENFDLALEKARQADERRQKNEILGELDGVPVAIKDAICVKNILTTAGSKILQNYYPPYSATVIEKLESAGAIIFGKTNLDAFAHGSSTENSDFGPSKNPWDLSRVPGGSSGGSAVAVSASLAPAALGSDTGGSIRLPASFCGITGFKPTYGAVSRYGLIAMASSFDQIGPMASSAQECRQIFEVISGRDQRDATSFDVKDANNTNKKFNQLANMTIGLPKEYFTPFREKSLTGLADEIDSDVKQVIKKAIAILQNQGAKIVNVSLPNSKYGLAVYYIVQPTEVASNLARYDGILFGKTREYFGQEAKRRIMLGTFTSSAGYVQKYYHTAQKVRELIKQDFDKVFEKVDMIISPVSPTPAFKFGEKVEDPLKMYLSDILTVPVNPAGLPAISAPAGFVKREGKDLPVGMQIIGAQKADYKILEVVEKYQEITDWHNIKPKVL
ncbi:MAG: aspartyl-tRNA(Asn)/glutamyl-tRNA (Gln) amidotransferase subunit A [Candidatus Berkelbacteria bacterium Licking1014_7]|uniref:Glutamyl-tRNA(Gln) amidotransferase subunit A n=1 Tax=Candidatus Berkelbacteria bacterium Licking1014_7 TaxID=2017147 RepID=A0A554LIA8_9BACT|nr:MAG: aspartyl-tRNA(Asn)/glutamyl-tRNA (Gln) amidotransferase subunit A [Candidatus Berkelbacteria bacterium Licking1014_7]